MSPIDLDPLKIAIENSKRRFKNILYVGIYNIHLERKIARTPDQRGCKYYMFEVTIKINVKNQRELVEKYSEEFKNEKLTEGSINEKIENEIKKQIKEDLQQGIKREFLKNKVKAKIVIK